MRKFVAIFALAAAAMPAAALAAVPVPRSVVLAVDRKVPIANFMPTRMLPGYRYASWSYRKGMLRMVFRGPGTRTIVWTVQPMTGTCDAGKEKSFQLAGNKVYWSHTATGQRAWRCVGAARLETSTALPPTRFADTGLGLVSTSARRIR